MNSARLLALVNPAAPGAAVISLTDALLLLALAGAVVVAFQLSRVLQRLDAIERQLRTDRAQPAPAPAARPTESAGEALPPRELAVIAAACHVLLGRRARIVAISEATDQKQVWSLEGRRQIFASHRPR